MRVARLLCILLALAWPPMACATSWSTDMSDLWFNPAESGWGMQVVQTYDLAFVTIYVYGRDRSPVWYSAIVRGPIANMTGELRETKGPWFGGAFTGTIDYRVVGALTINAIDTFEARVTYTVDGTLVTKTVQRQELGREDNGGLFRGAVNVTRTKGACSTLSAGKGQAGELEIVQPDRGAAMRGVLRVGSGSCTMPNGDYIQNGRFGDVYGAATCSNGDGGTLYVYEMRASYDTMTARFEYVNAAAGCTLVGDFAGVRM